MGIFGRKKDIPEGIRIMYYEGGLKEFPCNFPCQILLMENALRITKINPYVEVMLERNRINSIDILTESEYMAKFKGTATETTKVKAIPKTYYVFNYVDKNGNNTHLDFWGTGSETIKIRKMREELMKSKTPTSYSI